MEYDWVREMLEKAYLEDREKRRELFERMKKEFECPNNDTPNNITECF